MIGLELRAGLASLFPLKLKYKDVPILLEEKEFNVKGFFDEFKAINPSKVFNDVCFQTSDGSSIRIIPNENSVAFVLLYYKADEDGTMEFIDC